MMELIKKELAAPPLTPDALAEKNRKFRTDKFDT